MANIDSPTGGRPVPGSEAVGETSADGTVATLAGERHGNDLDALPDICFLIDEDGTILDCRGGDRNDLAIPRNRLIGKRVTRCPFGDVGLQFEAAIEATRATRKPISIEYDLPCDNGLAHFEARLVRPAQGPLRLVVRNTTRQSETASAISRSEREHRELFLAAQAPMLLLDADSARIVECNRGAESLYQKHRAGLIGASLADLLADAETLPGLESVASSGIPSQVLVRQRLGEQRVAMVEMSLSRVVFHGQHTILSVQREIDQATGRPVATDERLAMMRATLDATADGILVVDGKGNFVTCNRPFTRMWQIPEDLLQPGREREAAAFALSLFVEPRTLIEELIAIHGSEEDRASTLLELVDGRSFECVSLPRRVAGVQAGRVWSFRDVTDRTLKEQQIRHDAYHDPLTGLPNRTLFHDRLLQGLAQSRRAESNTALLLVDLDRFKTINDTLGHDAGDQLLVEVAKRLMSRKREGDTIARLGGDEFVLLVSQLRHKEDAAVVAEQVLEVLEPPIQIAEHDLHVSASIGIAIFPEDGDEATTLMKSADVALYRAKELGRNNYQIYEPKLSKRAMERLVMEKDLRQAIHNREFIVQYQPQYDLRTGQMRGVEALVRWMRAGQVVPPDKFVSIAEECGLVVPLGRWVLEEAARSCAEFNRLSRHPLRVCVNVSALQIQRPNFANEVSQVLQDVGLPMKQLVLELTESALMQNPEQGSWAMAQLEQMGVGIAMDDFGTGHSSLSHVSHLPIAMIKIDRSFVKNCAKRKTDETILSAIIKMGHALGLKVLAEGVETESQLRVLNEHGCDEVQGYLYSRPVSTDKLIELLER